MPVAGLVYVARGMHRRQGVEPDFVVENSQESLAAGIDTQLERALEVVQCST